MTKNEKLDHTTCFGFDKHYTWDIICDICDAVIVKNSHYHGESYYGRREGHSVGISKYTDEKIDVCTKHSDKAIEKFIEKLQKLKDENKSL